MKNFHFIDTKFLAINGDLSNTVSGGTAMLQNEVFKNNKKFVIQAKLPTVENECLTVEVINNQLIISASVQKISKSGVVFTIPFGSKAFRIPEGVDFTEIEAFEKDGFLRVEMPYTNKRIRQSRRNIDINFDDEF